jgi:hypothetical protein
MDNQVFNANAGLGVNNTPGISFYPIYPTPLRIATTIEVNNKDSRCHCHQPTATIHAEHRQAHQ